MKWNKQMHENEQGLSDHPTNPIYENRPFDRRTFSGDRTQCQDVTVKSFEKRCAHRPKLSAHAALNQIRGLLQRVDTDLGHSVDTAAHRELIYRDMELSGDADLVAVSRSDFRW
jgi:hypothetical protein